MKNLCMGQARRYRNNFLLLAVLAGCAVPPSTCPAGARALRAELYFGRSMPGGGAIEAAAWQGFLAATVTPRFPDGLTVLEGHGQWRKSGTSRMTREDSSVVVIVAPADEETTRKLDDIRAAYRGQFHQDSVGLVLSDVCAAF